MKNSLKYIILETIKATKIVIDSLLLAMANKGNPFAEP